MKKLFSYLLISSMVVLSSCTNYDDQFDDLNSQINSLKSQIEGFSSLSSGLTALQGTVASLQSAVAQIPTTTTDVSGLEASVAALQASLAGAATSEEAAAIQTQLTAAQAALASAIADNATASDTNADSIAALQTSLEAVTATLAELKTKLDGASTAEEVSQLSLDLAAVQSDLTDLLNQNNIYSTDVSITDEATLDFADALGNKLNIVNAKVEITQTEDMDAAQLQTVMDRIKTVTGLVTFDASATGITTTPAFNNLTSVTGVFTLTQKADVSLPKLKTASTLTITDDNKITSISAPMLETYTTLGTTSHNKVTNYSMPMLKRFSETQNSGNFTLTVDGGTVDFSSVTTISTAATPAERKDDITINGATIVKAPLVVSGKLTMNSVEEPNFPAWEGDSGSVFAKAKKVVLPSITGAVNINLNNFAPKATYFHMIGAEFNPPTDASANSSYPTFTTTGNTVIETLILGGSISSVTVSGATDLTSYTHTGKSHDVDFINNDSMSSVTFGHTTTLNTGAKGVAVTYGTLEVSGNAEITSVSAPELDDISKLDINGNPELTTLSFPKLNSLGKDSDGTALTAGQGDVNITNNKLTASEIQLPTATNVLPAVAGKITESAGLKAISTWIGLAAALDTAELVTIDNVTSVLKADGTSAAGVAFSLSTSQKEQTWNAEDDAIDIVSAGALGAITVVGVDPVYQKQTYKMSGSIDTSASDFVKLYGTSGTDLIAETTIDGTFTGAITGFVASDIDTWAEAVGTDLQAKLDANNADYTVSVAKDFGRVGTYTVDMINGAGAVTDGTGVSNTTGVITFTFGSQVTTSVSGATTASLTESMVLALNASKAVSGTWSAATNSTANNIVITPLLENGTEDTSFEGNFPDFSLSAANYTNAVSTTSFLPASWTLKQRSKSAAAQWRLTLQNDDTSFDASNLNTAETASFATASGITLTELVEGTNLKAASQTDLHVDFANVKAKVDQERAASTKLVDLRSWL